ncbi:MAG: SDR family oxidoreductase [candidate division NC10 bacterium]|nr:SDR family oxidoreductase [candidate division NC10 bacterium]MBI2163271.1 SDR family oxidoreductase [candidate division NC10 bacterium]MBI2458026.1 SDR family oxidoreductase [candidate division NC10 bacterium]MBI3085502.1 SDR family oxidoreductase [candidate division NC10 bacterium]
MRDALKDRVAVITGASSGIGRAAALAFAREGVRVILGARRTDRLQETVEAIRSAGGTARSLQTDVTRPAEVTRLVREAVTAFGRLDILVNNAGLGYFGRLESMPIDEARHLFEVNVMGTLYGIQAAVPIMRSQQSGHIINVASVVGKRATPGSGVYSATKFAQVGLSESLRLEVADAGIHVSVICPVSTMTEFFEVAAARSPLKFDPTGPTYTAEQVAEVIVRCARRPRTEVILYPPARLMVILNAVSPWLMDRVLATYWKKIRPGL